MSEAHNEHESAIKTPKQLIVAVIAAFLVPIVLIVLLTQYVAGNKLTGAGLSDKEREARIEARIKPVADEGYVLKDSNAPKQLMAAAEVYKSTCAGCHDSGAAGAPKTGDAGGWAKRLGQGYDTLVSHAVKGIRGMPAKGGNPDLDDVEVARAVVFMANQSGAKFKEPEVKAAAPAAAAPAASAPAASAPAAK
jgi:cytochrome c5